MNTKFSVKPLSYAITQQKNSIKIQEDVEYKLCRVQLHARGIVLRSKLFGHEIKTKKQQVCKANQFLVAEIDAKMGGFGIVPEELDGAIVSSHYYLYDIDESKLFPKYLDYYLQTPTFQNQVVSKGSTNYARIPPGDVLQYKIPLPKTSLQLKIIDYIDSLKKQVDEIVELNKKTTEEIKVLLPSIYQKVFVITDN